MQYKNIVVVNTKGGVGKSTIAFHVLPFFLKGEKEFEIIEIDNNNNTSKYLQSSKYFKKMKSVNVDESTAELEELVIKNMLHNDTTTIIDAGGGDDTLKVIESLESQNLVNDTLFIVPFSCDFAQIANLLNTINKIKNYNFIVVANNLDLQNKNDIMFVTGSEDFELPNFSEMFEEKFAIVEKTNLFSYSLFKKMSITDLAESAFDFEQNEILAYAKEKTKSNKDEMLKIYRNWKISKLAKDYLLFENMQNFKKMVIGKDDE